MRDQSLRSTKPRRCSACSSLASAVSCSAFVILAFCRSSPGRPNSVGSQAPKHPVDFDGWRLRAAVEPPGQDRHVGADDILDDEFAWGHLREIPCGGRGQFGTHQIRQDLADAAETDFAATAPGQGTIEFQMISCVLEQ